MSTAEEVEEGLTKKASKLPLIVGAFLATLGGAGGFFVTQSGLIGGASIEIAEHSETDPGTFEKTTLPDLAFVELDPLVISLPSGGSANHLRIKAQLEVVPEYRAEVEAILPRIVDTLYGYLMAVDIEDLSDRTALLKLRAHMLRRAQVIAGSNRIRDLLITEFVLN